MLACRQSHGCLISARLCFPPVLQMQTQAQHIKFVVELYDKCHETCVQYIQFLQVSLNPSTACAVQA